MTKPPIRQHTVPATYLRGFLAVPQELDPKGMLWAYDSDADHFFEQTPENLMIFKDMYTFEDENGEDCYELETIFAEHIEPTYANIVRKLEAKDKLSNQEEEDLSTFMALQCLRSTSKRRQINAMARAVGGLGIQLGLRNEVLTEKWIGDWNKEHPDQPVTKQDLEQSIKQIEVTPHRNEEIRIMLESLPDHANHILNMNWMIVHAGKGTSFITSDNPFCISPPKNRPPFYRGWGLKTPGVIIHMPLSKNICIYMHTMGTQRAHLDAPNKGMVRGLNATTAACSDRFIASKDRAWLERIKRVTKLNEHERKPQATIDSPFGMIEKKGNLRRKGA